MATNHYKPLVPRNFQNFYCRYCGARQSRRIGTGKPSGALGPCYYQAANGQRVKRAVHVWVYGDKY